MTSHAGQPEVVDLDTALARRIKLPAGRYRISAFGKDNEGASGDSAPRRSRDITFRMSTP